VSAFYEGATDWIAEHRMVIRNYRATHHYERMVVRTEGDALFDIRRPSA
jgi:hypothetical protein